MVESFQASSSQDSQMVACPCGSARPLSECCGVFLAGGSHPTTALELMRSRYTAYSLRNAEYLLKTWHTRTRPKYLDFSGDETRWEKLDILGHEGGGPEDPLGMVEFVACYRQGGVLHRLHEKSRFIKEKGEWLYVDGDIQPSSKPGRNDPCPCGSGKKFKKCCG